MIIGLGLLALAGFVLIRATSRVHLASATMADGRQATRAAETVLSQLQAGLQKLSADPDAQVRIAPAAGSDEKIGEWVEVTATVRGQSRTLTGRIPRSLPQSGPAQGATP